MMDYLDAVEREKLEALRQVDPFAAETLRQCDRICASREFARVSHHTKDFLCFVVAKKLLQLDTEIKEITIALKVFGDAKHNPAESTRIRVAGKELRDRLDRYAKHEGRNDPITIFIPKGSYVPEISARRASVAILFENWNPKGDQEYLCSTVSEEIAHQLTSNSPIDARPVPTLPTDHGLMYELRGSVKCLLDKLRLDVSLSDLKSGDIVSCETFEGPRDDILKLSRRVATAVVAALRPKTCNPKDHRLAAESQPIGKESRLDSTRKTSKDQSSRAQDLTPA